MKKEPQYSVNNCKKVGIYSTSFLVCVGAGLAMMPVFNKQLQNLKDYGVNVKINDVGYGISIFNTLIAMGTYAGFNTYKFLYNRICSTSNKNNTSNYDNEQQSDCWKGTKDVVKKAGCVAVALVPVYLLWSVQLNNQKIDESYGFDKFIAWATFTTLPLFAFKSTNMYERIKIKEEKESQNELELKTVGSKLFVYGIDSLAFVGRGISYYKMVNDSLKLIIPNDTVSSISAALIGGIGLNTISAFSEHFKLKQLFTTDTEGINKKQIGLSVVIALEGAWFALPVVGVGLNSIKEISFLDNPLLKGAIYFPLLVSRSTSETISMYEVISPPYPPYELPSTEENEISVIGNSLDEQINYLDIES